MCLNKCLLVITWAYFLGASRSHLRCEGPKWQIDPSHDLPVDSAKQSWNLERGPLLYYRLPSSLKGSFSSSMSGWGNVSLSKIQRKKKPSSAKAGPLRTAPRWQRAPPRLQQPRARPQRQLPQKPRSGPQKSTLESGSEPGTCRLPERRMVPSTRLLAKALTLRGFGILDKSCACCLEVFGISARNCSSCRVEGCRYLVPRRPYADEVEGFKGWGFLLWGLLMLSTG